jgi:hypothetical protein
MSDVDNKFSQEMQTAYDQLTNRCYSALQDFAKDSKVAIHSDKQAEIVQFLLADVMRNYYNASYGVKDNE